MQNIRYVTCLLISACALVVAAGAVAAQDKEATIRANLAKLPEKDRKLAEAQKWCAVETDDRLGATGVPVKIPIQDKPVFLCCKSCIDQANESPHAKRRYVSMAAIDRRWVVFRADQRQ